jgi:glycosyltransferase involved in cell wall biosynthesis
MRTLLLSPELFLGEGGIARIMRCYLKALCENADPGDRIDALVLNDSPTTDARLPRYATPALGQIVGCNRRKFEFIQQVFQLTANADQVICGHLHQLPLLWAAQCLRPGFRYYLVAHGIEVWRPYSLLETRTLLGAHRIFCVSQYTRLQLLRFCPTLNPARLLIVPNTLDPHLAFNTNTESVRQSSSAGPEILSVSRLTAADNYKGIDTLIEALPLILRELPLAQLRIVGNGDDTARLRALAARLGVTAAVHFTGLISDESLRYEYAACDLFALPSRREGFGLVYLEAMAFGKSCLAARAGGAPEVVNDRIGALADYGNIPDIAAAVLDLVRHPRNSADIRQHGDTFAFPTFRARLATALA